MDEEKQTTNTGGTRAKAESKSEGKSTHSEKLKTEKTSSSASKSKFGKSKKGENGSKLKKTGQGKRRIGLKVPIPTPPPPGSKNFHGHEFSESNDVSEDLRDNAGFTGVMVGANIYRWETNKPKCHVPDYAEHPEWVHKGDLTKTRYVSPEEMENIRGGRIGKAIETDGSSTPKHKTFYTRFCEHDASHDYSSLREGKKLTTDQMEEVSKNHGFRSVKEAGANSETATHKSYYSMPNEEQVIDLPSWVEIKFLNRKMERLINNELEIGKGRRSLVNELNRYNLEEYSFDRLIRGVVSQP